MTVKSQSIIYRNSRLYNAAMRALYGRYYCCRYRVIADLVEDRSTVVDLCCGPPVLYDRFLRQKRVDYTGIDINERFVGEVVGMGARGLCMDLRSSALLPSADYLIMQASLYHFLPDPSRVVDQMIASAHKSVIISEPIRNLSTSRFAIVAFIARHAANPGSGGHTERFDLPSLDQFFAGYAPLVEHSLLAPGAREKIYVLKGRGGK
ncbi:MAG: hypothetical protein JO033_29315 [Acidobacteriaceae bacterium]|nr:hypothetical protein [Acidobacteriaceae bacterium]